MTPAFPDEERESQQEATAILMLRVALALLGEARLHGDFGVPDVLAERAAALAAEFGEGAPFPDDPKRPAVEARRSDSDSIALSAPEGDGGHSFESLRLDGVLFGGGGGFGISAESIDPTELSAEEQAEMERRMAEMQVEMERRRQFTATRYVRTVAAPPQPNAKMPILAVELFEEGFYVEYTFDQEPEELDLTELSADHSFAEREKRAVIVEDDLGTEYFESGGGGGGGLRVFHSCVGFAPAPPPDARALRVTAGGSTVELDL